MFEVLYDDGDGEVLVRVIPNFTDYLEAMIAHQTHIFLEEVRRTDDLKEKAEVLAERVKARVMANKSKYKVRNLG